MARQVTTIKTIYLIQYLRPSEILLKRCENGELEYSELFHEIKDLSSQDLLEMKISYHKSCYANLVHKHWIERGEKRLQMAKDSANIGKVFTNNVGRPRKENLSDDEVKLRLIADLEIIDVVKLELNDERDKVINMNEIQDTYLDILRGLGYCILEPN